MNRRIPAILIAVLMIVIPLVGSINEIRAAEGYSIKGIEAPLKGEAEIREIEIVPTIDKETTVDNFEITITNPDKPKRTIYSSIVWLGKNKVEGNNNKQILNSTKYNLTLYKNDKIELKVISTPYELKNIKNEKTNTTHPSNPDKTIYIPGEKIYDRDCYIAVCEREHERRCRNCDPDNERCKQMCWDHCDVYADYHQNYSQYPECIKEGYGRTERTPQGTYTQSITTTTEKYVSPELDIRHKPIEISGTNLILKNNTLSLIHI